MTTTAELRHRLARTQNQLVAAGHTALVVSPGADLRYLSGHDVHPSERITALVVRAHRDPVLVTPTLEKSLAAASPVGELDIEVATWDETDDPYALIAALVDGPDVLISDRMWAQHLFGLQSSDSLALTSAAGLMGSLRSVKSTAEIAALRAAARAIDSVHAQMEQWLRAGRTENEVAGDLDAAIRDAGHAQVDFVIVGSGPNGASPHHEASDRRIEAGDMVVVDIGGTMPDGYCSDSTRTYVVGGEPTAAMTAMYDVLANAQQAARDAVREGVTAESIDLAAREVITDGGYGPHFIHRTGHGIGLETHEPPYIVAGNGQALAAGSAFSIEPGIYLDRQFGARIEDIVAVTAAGVDVLNSSARDLRVLA